MKTNHVLLIDDNEIDNFISNHVIQKTKIAEKITVKGSAVEALEYLEAVKDDSDAFPDLIFLDIAMPIMDGFGFLEEIGKFPKPQEKKCVVVMLSSSNNRNDIARAMDFDVVIDFFTKPLRIEMVEDLVQRKKV
ncbi:response regulator [Flavobacterium sp. XGLA_31]|uniref:response regulator n=1 Tax=Flavobacterium sp. XGLA_31 TaxID=3447666 RepID=UPI003F391838